MMMLKVIITFLVLQICACFVIQPSKQSALSWTFAAAVVGIELQPEPDGGREIAPLKSMDGCRVKELEAIKTQNNGEAYKFWMTGLAQGELVKEIRTQILKDASKKANFPGFRKGQVPPYAQPQITQFAVQEGILKTIEGAVEAYGLKSLSGSDGEVQVHEDVKEIAKTYKTGDSIAFTATFNAGYESATTAGSEESMPSEGAEETIVIEEAT